MSTYQTGELFYRFDLDGTLIELEVVTAGRKQTTLRSTRYPDHRGTAWRNDQLAGMVDRNLIFRADQLEAAKATEIARIEQRTSSSSHPRLIADAQAEIAAIEAATI